eukprot:GGOE01065342.1.p1 GENE.GGOE01065342.1~~GGOE01065342.1.p1  ORF type:complete len:392 (+),score=82.20 GGOE01065342.1:38-1213(+)
MSHELFLCSYQAYSGGLVAGYFQWDLDQPVCHVRKIMLGLVGKEVDRAHRKGPEMQEVKGLEDAALELSQGKPFEQGTHLFLFQLHLPVGTPATADSVFFRVDYQIQVTVEFASTKPSIFAKPLEILGPASAPYGNSACWKLFFLTDTQMQATEATKLQHRQNVRQEQLHRLQEERHACMTAVVPVEVERIYENERRFMGWSRKFLLPTDRLNFTDETLKPKAREDVCLPTADWQWEDEWHVDCTASDVEGWQYAFNWPHTGILGSKEWRSKACGDSFVRRRLWVRTRSNPKLRFVWEQTRIDYDTKLAALSQEMESEQVAWREQSEDRQRHNQLNTELVRERLNAFISLLTPVVQGRMSPLTLFDHPVFAPPPCVPRGDPWAAVSSIPCH